MPGTVFAPREMDFHGPVPKSAQQSGCAPGQVE